VTDESQEKPENLDAILRLRKTLKPGAIPRDKLEDYTYQLFEWQENLRKKIKKPSLTEVRRVWGEMKTGGYLRTIELKVSLEKAVYRLLQILGLPQREGDPAENAIDYILTFNGYVFTLYDSHSEELHLGYLSPIETPFPQLVEMRKRGERPPEEPPPQVADELRLMIEDLVNYPIAARTGIIL